MSENGFARRQEKGTRIIIPELTHVVYDSLVKEISKYSGPVHYNEMNGNREIIGASIQPYATIHAEKVVPGNPPRYESVVVTLVDKLFEKPNEVNAARKDILNFIGEIIIASKEERKT